jgi:hypothetical protein
MAFCQSIITLVARRGLIDGSGPCGPPKRDRPWHLRLAAHRCRDGVPRTAWALDRALDRHGYIVAALEKAGANATTVPHALILVEHDGSSGAILDRALGDGDSTNLCARLKERGIPYISYSGYSAVAGAHITKHVPMDFLMSALEELLPSTPRVS